jgi:hypothetical protein
MFERYAEWEATLKDYINDTLSGKVLSSTQGALIPVWLTSEKDVMEKVRSSTTADALHFY